MHQPSEFQYSSRLDDVYLLQRSLYGRKQAPHVWFQHFIIFISHIAFVHSRSDSSLFIYKQGTHLVYLILYVDDYHSHMIIILVTRPHHLHSQFRVFYE